MAKGSKTPKVDKKAQRREQTLLARQLKLQEKQFKKASSEFHFDPPTPADPPTVDRRGANAGKNARLRSKRRVNSGSQTTFAGVSLGGPAAPLG